MKNALIARIERLLFTIFASLLTDVPEMLKKMLLMLQDPAVLLMMKP